ncbi:hypothetical protein OHA21_13145 [Actinoplanes sp. NBC_00393]|uniref:hypothetical protein n=1 Tax=Actinoplanes sp. NBC_00393 TaxID=2975953 RepID=UPI002E211430
MLVEVTAVTQTLVTMATAASPAIGMDADMVVLRGRLAAQPDEVAVLDLGETSVLLDLAGPVPPPAWNSWVECRAPSRAVEIYPCEL